MWRLGQVLLTSWLFLGVLGCGGSAPSLVQQGAQMYTLTNLRANQGNVIYSINRWIEPTVLPVCTQVEMIGARGREIRFTANGVVYRYIVHDSSELPLAEHLQRYFGTECPGPAGLPGLDQAGVQAAQPAVGMTKRGVIMALGYPPDHRTPTLETPMWTYWGRGEIQLHFEGDQLARMEGAEAPTAPLAVQPAAAPVAQRTPAPGAAPAQGTAAAPAPQAAPVAPTGFYGGGFPPAGVQVVLDENGYPVPAGN